MSKQRDDKESGLSPEDAERYVRIVKSLTAHLGDSVRTSAYVAKSRRPDQGHETKDEGPDGGRPTSTRNVASRGDWTASSAPQDEADDRTVLRAQQDASDRILATERKLRDEFKGDFREHGRRLRELETKKTDWGVFWTQIGIFVTIVIALGGVGWYVLNLRLTDVKNGIDQQLSNVTGNVEQLSRDITKIQSSLGGTPPATGNGSSPKPNAHSP